MTCQEFLSCYDDHVRAHDDPRSASREMAEHAATCPACDRFVEAQRELGKSLLLVRESAGPVPASLDATILAGYRRHMIEQRAETNPAKARQLGWGVAFAWSAAALASGAILFVSLRGPATPVVQGPRETPAVTRPAGDASPISATTGKSHSAKPWAMKVRRHARPAEHPSVAAMGSGSPLPEGFRSLMYCDELSCGDTMDMIRIQLPSAVVARAMPGLPQSGGPVNADVLVGPDGIARGIRIVE